MQGGRDSDLNPKRLNGSTPEAKAKRSRRKNALSYDDIDKCRELFEGNLYSHQREWWEASDQVFRFILKSRQIGATWEPIVPGADLIAEYQADMEQVLSWGRVVAGWDGVSGQDMLPERQTGKPPRRSTHIPAGSATAPLQK